MMKKRILLIILTLSLSLVFMLNVNAEENIKIYVDDSELTFDINPYFEDEATFVPVRAIFEALGAEVFWEGETNTAIIKKDKTIKLQVNSKEVYVDNEKITLNVPVKEKNGKVFVPIQLIKETLGADVEWIEETKTYFIKYKENKYGNTSGNTSNSGYVAYDGEYVYYSHLDSGLVKERIDGTESTVLLNNEVFKINVMDDWIYFYNRKEINSDQLDLGIFKIKKDGTDLTQLHNGSIDNLQVVNDWIYYIDPDQTFSIYKMKLDGTQVQRIGNESNIWSMSVYDGWIFYQDSRSLYKMRIDGSQNQLLCQAIPSNQGLRTLDIVIEDDWVYFNTESTLNRIRVDGTSEETIIDTEINTYNIVNDFIIFHDDVEDNNIKKLNINTNEISSLVSGNRIGWIFTASDNIYYMTLDIDLRESYQAYNEELLRMDLDGNSINNVYPKEGDEYFEIYDILNKTLEAMQDVNKYICEKSINNSTTKGDQKVSVNLSSYNKYDILNRKSYEKITYDVDDHMDEIKETWFMDNYSYIKSSNEKDWLVNEHTDQNRDEIFNKVKNFSFIQPTTFLCNSLSISNESTTKKLVLEGEGWFEINLLRLASLENEQLEDYQKNRNMKIKLIIDKQTNRLEYINLSYTMSNEANETISMNIEIKYSNMNGYINITPTSSVLQAKSKQNQAKPYVVKAIDAFMKGNYDESISYCNSALNVYSHSSDAYGYRAMALFEQEKYEEAINDYKKYLRYYPNDYDIILQLAECYLYIGDYEKNRELCRKVSVEDPRNAQAYNLYGLALMYQQNYEEALKHFEYAINLDEEFAQVYYNKLNTLYYLSNYKKCIEFSDEIESKFGGSSNLYWYKATCYEYQNNYEEAVKEYHNVLKYDSQDYYAMTNLAYDYYYLQDYDTSKIYVEKALNVQPDYDSAIWLRNNIEYQETTSESQKIVDFVKYNYLYDKNVQDIENKANDFILKGDNISSEDIQNFIKEVKNKDDKFTFVISGEDYLNFTENQGDFWEAPIIQNGIYHSDIKYVGFNEFSFNTGSQFIEYIQKIYKPEERYLVVDLRNNSGGLTHVANEMLDILLPECTTSYLVEKNGNIQTYESNQYNIKFKHIIILVNQNTASSAELFTLSLKKHLDNVTVIGTSETYGKGVGQTVYENKKMNFMILLVQHYWNVMEQNINGQSIKPDYSISDESESFTQILDLINELDPDYSTRNGNKHELDPEIQQQLEMITNSVLENK